MDNNDIFKKLRVALQLRDDQIVDILQLVDFRISKGEIGNFFRNPDHPKYMECGDQVLRNFLNGLVIHLRGTKEQPKNANDVLDQNRKSVSSADKFPKDLNTKNASTAKKPFAKRPSAKKPSEAKPAAKTAAKSPAKPKKGDVVEKVRFKNGKK